MTVLRSVLAIAFLTGSFRAAACPTEPPSFAQVQTATFVAFGRAVSSDWDKPTERLLVRVAVTDVRKGNALDMLVATSPCRVPIKKDEAVVVLQIQSKFLVYPAEFYTNVLGHP